MTVWSLERCSHKIQVPWMALQDLLFPFAKQDPCRVLLRIHLHLPQHGQQQCPRWWLVMLQLLSSWFPLLAAPNSDPASHTVNKKAGFLKLRELESHKLPRKDKFGRSTSGKPFLFLGGCGSWTWCDRHSTNEYISYRIHRNLREWTGC